jgi:hypothetical protein
MRVQQRHSYPSDTSFPISLHLHHLATSTILAPTHLQEHQHNSLIGAKLFPVGPTATGEF